MKGIVNRLYQTFVTLRHFMFDVGLLPTKKVEGIFSVGVGNVVVGGTGKTPLVLRLLQETSSWGVPTGVLTRGFGRFKGVGDEALLVKKKFPHVELIVDANRVRGALEAKKRGVRLLFLDDALQHRYFTPDIMIGMVRGTEREESFLPFGVLRDLPSRLTTCDLLVSKEKEADVLFTPRLQPFLDPKGRPLSIQGPLGVYCGLAHPQSFIKSLSPYQIVGTLYVRDHAVPTRSQLQKFAKECQSKGACAIVTTEKDAVKWEEKRIDGLLLPLGYAPMDLELIKGQARWTALLERIHDEVVG